MVDRETQSFELIPCHNTVLYNVPGSTCNENPDYRLYHVGCQGLVQKIPYSAKSIVVPLTRADKFPFSTYKQNNNDKADWVASLATKKYRLPWTENLYKKVGRHEKPRL
jgi:hypothetical protein